MQKIGECIYKITASSLGPYQIFNEKMRKGLKRKTYQNLPSLICVEFFLPITGIELPISRSKGLRLNDRDQQKNSTHIKDGKF
jgi:hypothetical protein